LISEDLAMRLWPLTEGRRLNKVRYKYPENSLVWEINRIGTFPEKSIFLAEVELPTKKHKFKMPKWLKKLVVAEVTEDLAYEGCNLAQ
jgi:CYTH domain-containing protein